MRRLLGGSRPFAAALLLTLLAVGTMSLGPLQRYTTAADRVESLQATQEALRQQVDVLEDRRRTLSDPEELELIARTELGLVLPGEVPYIVVDPDAGDEEQVGPEAPETAEADGGPWYRRLGRSIGRLFSPEG